MGFLIEWNLVEGGAGCMCIGVMGYELWVMGYGLLNRMEPCRKGTDCMCIGKTLRRYGWCESTGQYNGD